MNRSVRGLSFVFLLVFLAAGLWGQTSFAREEEMIRRAGLYENVEVRSAMADAINAPFYSLLTRQKEIHSQVLSPVAVEFELRKSAESFYLLFKNERQYRYPVWGRGNYIIKRDLRSGAFQQIKIFIQNDEESYIRLFPLGEGRSTLDMSLYGVPLYSGIVLPVSLEDLSVTSFTRIMFLTRGTIRWDQILTDASYPEWRTAESLADEIRATLPVLHQAVDGAQNREGDFVRIETGEPQEGAGGVNCSGFVKWVADGLYLTTPVSGGELIDIERLKASTDDGSRTGNQWSTARQDRDPWFGLDWTRNLARIVQTAEGRRKEPGLRDLDVRSVPFFEYRDNIGYELGHLKTILYLLAVEHPGDFYLGAVNSPFGKDPVLWQYHHVAVFFPWFTEGGDFRLAVMETGTESSLESLEGRYPGSFIHLVNMKALEAFVPPNTMEYTE